MHKSSTLPQIPLGEWGLPYSPWMSFPEARRSDCVIFESYESLFAFHDEKGKHGFEQVCAFTGLRRPSPKRLSWRSALQRWIPILRTIVDYPAASFFDVLENFKVRIGDSHRHRAIGIHCSGARISNRSLVNANTSFTVKESCEVASIHWGYVDQGFFHMNSIPQL
jgi:hypothetical protein